MAEPNHPSLVWANDFLLDNGRRPVQLAPHGGIVPIRRTSDTYPQSEREQLYKPLISENQRDEDDIKHFYNPDLANSFHHQDYIQLEESGPFFKPFDSTNIKLPNGSNAT